MKNGSKSIVEIRKQVHLTHELISTSFHEAGHTIYGLLNSMKIDSVTIFEDKKVKRISGYTYYNSPDIQKIKDVELFSRLLESEIALKYAGLAAEKYHFKNISGSDKFPMFLREGSSNDTLSAAELIRKYNVVIAGQKRYAYKKKLINKTLKALQEHWDAVTLVAHNLFQKKKLDFQDLKLLLTKKSKNNKFWKNKIKNIEYLYNNSSNLDEKELKIILSS